MGQLKKTAAVCLAVMLLVMSLPVCAATERAWQRLDGLGIMTADENGDYRQDAAVTRAEFAAIAARLLRLGDMQCESAFSDVASEHWACGYISQMSAMGIISGMGDGGFAPEEAVTPEQGLKILVGCLGYAPRAEAQGGYPGGYTVVGSSLGLLKGLSQTGSTLLRGDVAQMVYNALDVVPFENYAGDVYTKSEETLGAILDAHKELNKLYGIVTETHESSLTAAVPSLDKGRALIGGALCKTDVPLRVGYYAEVYVTEEDGMQRIVNVAYPSGTNSVKTADAKTSRPEGGRFYYENENEKEVSVPVDANVTYLYNNRKADSFAAIGEGTYRLLDNDGDGSVDVIFTEESESFIVGRVNQSSGMVYFDRAADFRGRSGVKLDFEDEDKTVLLTDAEGNNLGIKDVASGGVLTVTASRDLRYISAVYSKKSVEGKIEELGEDYVVIDGTRYDFSYAASMQIGSNLKVGDTGAFLLDYRGRLVGSSGSRGNEGYVYGYCMDAQQTNGLSGTVQLKLVYAASPQKEVKKSGDKETISYYFQNNDPVIMDCADKVKINGTSYKSSEVDLSSLRDSLMAVKVNSSGKVTELLYEAVSGRGNINYTFNADIMTFGGETVTRGYVTDENTTFVCVPQKSGSDESDYLVQVKLTDEQENCRVFGRVFFADSSYESTEVQPMDVLMIKAAMDGSAAPVPTATDDVCIVGSVSQIEGSIREDAGSSVYKITLLNGSTQKEEVTASSGDAYEAAQTLRKGDLIRYNKDGFGRVNAIKKLCSVQGLKNEFADTMYTDGAETAMFGLIYDAVCDTFDYYSNGYIDKVTLSFAQDGGSSLLSYALKINKQDGPPVYLYNRAAGWIKPGAIEDVVTSRYAGSDASKAFALVSANDVQALVIIED